MGRPRFWLHVSRTLLCLQPTDVLEPPKCKRHLDGPKDYSPYCLQTDKDRFSEYPKLRDLVNAKDDQVKCFATPPTFLKVRSSELPCRRLQAKVCPHPVC